MSWSVLVQQWALLEFDFAAILHTDLEDAWRVRSWRWFAVRVRGLLSRQDSLVAAFFRPVEETPDERGSDDGWVDSA